MSHNANYKKLINSTRWLKLREWKVKNAPFCERCLERGRFTSVEEVHHIRPVESEGSIDRMAVLAYDPANLMSVCRRCHKEIHGEYLAEQRQMKRKRKSEKIRERVRENFKKADTPGG